MYENGYNLINNKDPKKIKINNKKGNDENIYINNIDDISFKNKKNLTKIHEYMNNYY